MDQNQKGTTILSIDFNEKVDEQPTNEEIIQNQRKHSKVVFAGMQTLPMDPKFHSISNWFEMERSNKKSKLF